jgi:hypothetical protein
MKNNTNIKKHLGLFLSALFLSASAFAYDVSLLESGLDTQKDFVANLDYLPMELLAWL